MKKSKKSIFNFIFFNSIFIRNKRNNIFKKNSMRENNMKNEIIRNDVKNNSMKNNIKNNNIRNNIIVNRVFLLSLIVLFSLSILSLNVLASTISGFTAFGSDNKNGLARPIDVVTISVNVFLPTTEDAVLDSGQLRFYLDDEGPTAMDCQAKSTPGDYSCTAQLQFANQRQSPLIDFYLFRDGAIGEKSQALTQLLDKQVVIDSAPPSITSFTASPSSSNTGNTQLSISISDGVKPGNCSGVHTIEIFENSINSISSAPKITLNIPEERTCFNTTIVDYSTTTQGDIIIIARATDYFGQTGVPKTIHFTTDSQKPVIDSAELIDDVAYLPVSAISPAGVGVLLNVTVNNANDIFSSGTGTSGTGTITADLRKVSVNGGIAVVPSVHSVSSSGVLNARWSFTLKNVNSIINPTNPSAFDCSIPIFVVDASGNNDSRIVQCSVVVDSVGPVVRSFEQKILGVNNNLSIYFNESGLGMARGNAYIKIELASGSILLDEQKARECVSDSANVWKCSWSFELPVQLSASNARVVVLSRTSDDGGNALISGGNGGNFQSFAIDTTPPSGVVLQRDTSIIPIDPRGRITQLRAAEGAQYTFKINASGFVSAVADFSQIGGGNAEQGVCDADDPLIASPSRVCTFSATISKSGSYTANITVLLSDSAGNILRVVQPVTVFAFVEARDYWRVKSVSCLPNPLDRFFSSLKPTLMFCTVNLEARPEFASRVSSSKAVPSAFYASDTSASSCIGDKDFIDEAPDSILSEASLSRVVHFKLKKSPYLSSEISFSCPFKVTTEMTNASNFKLLTKDPQELNITFNVAIAGNPSGNPYSRFEKKVDTALDDAEKWKKWVGDISKVQSMGEKLCGVRQGLIATSITLETLLNTVLAIPDLVTKGEWTASCKSVTTYQNVAESWWLLGPVLEPMCNMLSCAPSKASIGDKDSYTKSINEVAAKVANFGSNAGGGVSGIVGKEKGGIAGKTLDDLSTSVNPKESLLVSVYSLCIPGIIHNLDKYAEIQCEYARCLVEDVKKDAKPSICSATKDKQTCTIVVGEGTTFLQTLGGLFTKNINSVAHPVAGPLTNELINGFADIKKLLYNPAEAAEIAVAKICGIICENEASYGVPARILCTSAKLIAQVGKMRTYSDNLHDAKKFDFTKTGANSCDSIPAVRKEFNKAIGRS